MPLALAQFLGREGMPLCAQPRPGAAVGRMRWAGNPQL